MAAPTDGKPIVTWKNEDEAFLNVGHTIRAALRSIGGTASETTYVVQPTAPSVSAAGPRSRNLRVAKIVTEADPDRHLVEAFEYIAKFFENYIVEMLRSADATMELTAHFVGSMPAPSPVLSTVTEQPSSAARSG